MDKGITIAGNIIVDTIKYVARYPRAGMLSVIDSLDISVGGVLGNTIVDLAKMDPALKLTALGCVGTDENGERSRVHLETHDIDTSGLVTLQDHTTSFTDAIQDRETGQRTFLTYGGANDVFGYESIDYASLDTDIFHLGYALLLKMMDSADEEYGTVMAKTLAKVQSMGIKTSMDVVSEDSLRAAKIVRCSLKYCNYFIANEEETSTATAVPARDEQGKLIHENMEKILQGLFTLGVKELAVIHCPEGGFAMDAQGRYFEMKSFNLPDGFIVSSVGAGDAFCAGMLYGLYNEWAIEKSLAFANGAAAACLHGSGGTASVGSKSEIEALMASLG